MLKFITLAFILLFGATQPVFSGDRDKDGIPNKFDECKREPEDFDNYEDTDGCPDFDNDRDGVPDLKDKCPNTAEDLDGFEDTDGCPEIDNDKDGILDKNDKCPGTPEDFDSFEDMDGCPDPDNDKDGVLDGDDKCPQDAEDLDNFQDADGCPDFDNDKDGVRDSVDKCPLEPETHNDFNDADGCPDVAVKPLEQYKVYPTISFRTGTTELIFESEQPLNQIAKKLAAYPNHKIKLVLYHTFAISQQYSLELLARQHRALYDHLIAKGVSGDQLLPVDYSEEAYADIKGTVSDFNQDKPVELYLVTEQHREFHSGESE